MCGKRNVIYCYCWWSNALSNSIIICCGFFFAPNYCTSNNGKSFFEFGILLCLFELSFVSFLRYSLLLLLLCYYYCLCYLSIYFDECVPLSEWCKLFVVAHEAYSLTNGEVNFINIKFKKKWCDAHILNIFDAIIANLAEKS